MIGLCGNCGYSRRPSSQPSIPSYKFGEQHGEKPEKIPYPY